MKHNYHFIALLILPFLNFANEESPRYPFAVRTAAEQKKEGSFQHLRNYYPPVYYGPGEHCIVGVSAFGDSLEIEDGSQWKIAPYDKSIIESWSTQDPILIIQNNSWFSPYSYRIVNPATHTSIAANLFQGPFQNGAYTRYIMAIDPMRGEVRLNDQTKWQIAWNDYEIFREWQPNDAIIIGYNSGWNSSLCHGLLINVTLNRCVRAEQF